MLFKKDDHKGAKEPKKEKRRIEPLDVDDIKKFIDETTQEEMPLKSTHPGPLSSAPKAAPKKAPVYHSPAPQNTAPVYHSPAPEPKQEFSPKPVHDTAPLFVKLEKYEDIVGAIQEMKLFMASVKDLFTLMSEIEHIRNDTINVMKVTVQRLEKSVIEMDADLLRPKGVNMADFRHGEEEVKHIETSLTTLQKQIAQLRNELQGVR